MIIHGIEKKAYHRIGPGIPVEIIEGYYVVFPEGDRVWIGRDKYAAAKNLNKTLDKFNQADYWIDYCMGYDVEYRLAWNNLDHKDYILDVIEAMEY